MGRDKGAREIQAATGQRYTTALREYRRRWNLGEAKAFLLAVRATPPWAEGQPLRCVRCLAPAHGACDR